MDSKMKMGLTRSVVAENKLTCVLEFPILYVSLFSITHHYQKRSFSMPWNAVQMPNLLAAMKECDVLTLAVFRTHYGAFQEAHDLHMFYGQRGPYEARPLLAGAYANLFPYAPHIGPPDFMGNDAHEFLERFGFNTKDI